MITGNKGEWSELYVLLKLLADGKLFAADEKLIKLENVYFPILRIFRQEFEGRPIEYSFPDNKNIELTINGDRIRRITREEIKESANYLFKGILSGGERSFEIPQAETIMSRLNCEKIKAPSTDKTDIKMEVHDSQTGYTAICGYSIKSDLGSPPTLLNPSKHTNFIYEVRGISDSEMDSINAINAGSKVKARLEKLKGKIQFFSATSNVFSGNLMFIDSMMEEIIGEMLLVYYTSGINNCSDIATELEETDKLGYKRPGIYRYKIKKFLCAVALGLVPATPWDGRDEANGGYIIVTDSGDVLAYQLYNRDSFETYLLNNTRLDTASTGRYDFARLYKNNNRMYIDLNLQVRFTSNKSNKKKDFEYTVDRKEFNYPLVAENKGDYKE